MIQGLHTSGSTSPTAAKRQMKAEEKEGGEELSMCDSPKRKRMQVETTKPESVSTPALSAKAWAFSIDAIITTRPADLPAHTTSSETSDSEDWPQNEDELRSDPGLPTSEGNCSQLSASWSRQSPAPQTAVSPSHPATSSAPPPPPTRGQPDRFVDIQRRLWTNRDCCHDTPPPPSLKTVHRRPASPRTMDSRCSFLGANSSPPHQNHPESRMEPPKGSSSSASPLCRISKGTGDLARVRCQLETRDLWTKFNELGTEMIITKSGRRMFPVVRVSFTGLKPATKYLVLMDIVPVDAKRYRYAYHRSSWLVAGKADPDVQQRCYVHPDAPFLGDQLAKQAISFEKLKLTNNVMDKHGYIILNSMHKYQPRIHLIKRSAVEPFMATPPQSLNSIRPDEIKTFEFPETVFIAVTAYQNQLITKLKIDCNPFAKGFRDSARLSDFERESMETLLATHTGTGNGGVIASLSNQFRNYLPSGTERTSEAAEDEALPPKRAPTPTFLHPSVLHQLTEVLSSPSKMHALYRRPSDGEDLVKRLNSLQRHYQSQPGITTTTTATTTQEPTNTSALLQRIGLSKSVPQATGGTFTGGSLKPIDLSGTGPIREEEADHQQQQQQVTSHWLTSRRLPLLPPDMALPSPAAAMLTYLHMIQQAHGGPSGPLLGKSVGGPRAGVPQAPVMSAPTPPLFPNYRQLREDAARLIPTLATPTLMK